MVKAIVAGSRSITDEKVVEDAMNESPLNPFNQDELIFADANGVDKLAKDICSKYPHIVFTEFEAEWERYGKSAGDIRNEEMAEYADVLVAIWDGESPGTKNMIDIALDHGLNVYVKTVQVEDGSFLDH